MADCKRKVEETIDALIEQHEGAVLAHIVRANLSGFSGLEQIDNLKRLVELLGFSVLDGFVMHAPRAETTSSIRTEADHVTT